MLLTLANAAKQRRPVEITYTAADGRRTERTVQPYGIVVHSGRWYIAGADSASGQNRTFRVDRISNPRTQSGTLLCHQDSTRVTTSYPGWPKRLIDITSRSASPDQAMTSEPDSPLRSRP